MIIASVIIAVIVLYLIYLYNRLFKMRNRIREAFQAVEVYLQQRFDTLIQIGEAVVAYAKHERDTLKEITAMRQGLAGRSISEKLQAYEDLNQKLEGIRIQAEDYPQLQASRNFLHLQHTVNDLEEKLSAARRTYNANVIAYNNAIGMIPAVLFAGMFGFKAESMYEVPESKKQEIDMKQLLKG
ncbi:MULTISPECIES: LemA family protein [unclassified Paenibacillus]|uniref:LemA family protein n=1 Tax=unclassified Paenibacillus TaxID=185978 RepID=UPI001C129810|nr:MULTISPECIES: LemA family protein [unclassified Paenibacillus]MBU5441890.1 LemA family protein [Paenibacillus sp. MSJ-34]CAH0122621.1 Protein LemA [Paenibacillus sp. CECT 9249]